VVSALSEKGGGYYTELERGREVALICIGFDVGIGNTTFGKGCSPDDSPARAQ